MVELIDIFRSVRQFAAQKVLHFWTPLLTALKDPKNDPFWQALHYAFGIIFTLGGAAWGGLYAAKHAGSGHQVLVSVLLGAALGAVVIGVAWGIPKEFGFDPYVEGASMWGGARDLSFYWGGIATALAFILVTVWILGVN